MIILEVSSDELCLNKESPIAHKRSTLKKFIDFSTTNRVTLLILRFSEEVGILPCFFFPSPFGTTFRVTNGF